MRFALNAAIENLPPDGRATGFNSSCASRHSRIARAIPSLPAHSGPAGIPDKTPSAMLVLFIPFPRLLDPDYSARPAGS
jgi:hypothetical protein